jgi:hypothetical protein
MAYEASAAEGSDASGALSDSTGVSPGQLPAGSGSAAPSGRPFLAGAAGRQRSVGGYSTSGSSLSREAGVAGLPSAAAAGLRVSALAEAAHLQHTPSGVSFGSSLGSALLDAGGHPGALMGAPSLAARSDTGSADPANVYMGELHECLLCRQHTCFPTGPATIRWVLRSSPVCAGKPCVWCELMCRAEGHAPVMPGASLSWEVMWEVMCIARSILIGGLLCEQQHAAAAAAAAARALLCNAS